VLPCPRGGNRVQRVKGRELTTKLITLGPPVTSRGCLPCLTRCCITRRRQRRSPRSPAARRVGGRSRGGRGPDTPTDQHTRAIVASRAPPCAADLVTAPPPPPPSYLRGRAGYTSHQHRSHTPLYSLLGPGHGQTTIAPSVRTAADARTPAKLRRRRKLTVHFIVLVRISTIYF